MMAGIRGRDTKPELLIRRGLHALGYRFRLGDRYRPGGKALPGKPDIVFPARRAAILVHGCFWHGHDCHLFRWPSTKPEFWQSKLTGNVARDRRTIDLLLANGWRVGVVWECQLKGRARAPLDEVVLALARFLDGDEPHLEIGSKKTIEMRDSRSQLGIR